MNKSKEAGITLISLVITIIVLLILAGVSIATLTGDNGILTKAQTAKAETEKASEEEQIQLAALNAAMNTEKYDYEVEDGIMFFKRPLKTKLNHLNFSTLDRMSIITSYLKNCIYVFAISAEEKYNKNLIEFSKIQKSDSKHYIFYVSSGSEEVNCID